jgi:transcriptional regulator with XRE-family HTH domain
VVNRKRQDPTESAAALFGYKLRKLRDERGLSQAKLADELHCSGDLISKIETAAQAATIETAALIDAYFGTDEQFKSSSHSPPKKESPAGSARTPSTNNRPARSETTSPCWSRAYFRSSRMPGMCCGRANAIAH